jgi:hypothetical protein
MTSWQALPDGVGTVLAVAGDLRVAAQSGRLRAWHGFTPVWRAEINESNPARPTVLSDRVLWGPYAIDLDTGAVTELAYARPAAGYAQTAHAWSPDGSRAVVAGVRRDPSGTLPAAAAWSLDKATSRTLWSGADVPPVAVFADSERLVIGHRSPDVYGTDGTLLRSLDGVTSPQRIDGRSARLLTVESGQLSVWDLDSGSLLGRRSGGWVDGCLTPDGQSVLAVDLVGGLCRLSVATGLESVLKEPVDGPVTGVATDGQVLLASFAELPGLRTRPL